MKANADNKPLSAVEDKKTPIPSLYSIIKSLIVRFQSIFYEYHTDSDELLVAYIGESGDFVIDTISAYVFGAKRQFSPALKPLQALKDNFAVILNNPPDGIYNYADERDNTNYRVYYCHETSDGHNGSICINGIISNLTLEQTVRHIQSNSTGYSLVTKLPDQTTTAALIDESIKQMTQGEKGMLFLLDIDGLTEASINCGQASVEHYLRQVAETLRTDFRVGDVIGQIDEGTFVIFFQGKFAIDVIENRAQNLVNLLKKVRTDAITTLSTHIGVAVASSPSSSYAALYPKASKALATAHQRGKNRYTIFGG